MLGFASVSETPLSSLPEAAGSDATGSLSATDPVESLSGAAEVDVAASLAATDPEETLAGAATVDIVATLAATDPEETLSGFGGNPATADLAATDPEETLSGSASALISGAASLTDVAETLAGVAGVLVSGTLTATEPNETMAATAVMSGDLVRGNIFDPLEALLARAAVTGVGAAGPASVITNQLLPPPRLVGEPKQDVAALSRWCNTLFDHLVRTNNIIGTVRAMIEGVAEEYGPNTNVATEFMRVLSEIDRLRQQVQSLAEGE